ncbi:MAG: hypothetical protein ACF8OB_00205, partial [Phycisphaeraceae bacterium JB051]
FGGLGGNVDGIWLVDIAFILTTQILTSKLTTPQCRSRVLGWSPLILLLLGFCNCYPFNYPIHYFPINNHVGSILIIGFAMGYCIQNIRMGSKGHRLIGMVFSFIFLLCILEGINNPLPYLTYYHYAIPIELSFENLFWLNCVLWVLIFIPLNDAARKRYVPPVTTLCDTCGYDLRGSAGQPTCPECGSAIIKVIKPLNTSSADA